MTGNLNNTVSSSNGGPNHHIHQSSSPVVDHHPTQSAHHLAIPADMRVAPYGPAATTTTTTNPNVLHHHLLPNTNTTAPTPSNGSLPYSSSTPSSTIPVQQSCSGVNPMQQLTNALTQFQHVTPATPTAAPVPAQGTNLMQSIAAAQILLNHPGVAQAAALTAAIQQLLQQTQMHGNPTVPAPQPQPQSQQPLENINAAINPMQPPTIPHVPATNLDEVYASINVNPNSSVAPPLPSVKASPNTELSQVHAHTSIYHKNGTATPGPPLCAHALSATAYTLPPTTTAVTTKKVPVTVPRKGKTNKRSAHTHKIKTIPKHALHPPSIGKPNPYSNSTSHSLPPGKPQQWTVQQLQSHILYQQSTNQPISQPMKLMLVEAQRREDKKTAKRAANRRSASESRARKKAFVEQMTVDNMRLKRQAQILALLPDMVLAMKEDGVITFISAQVERILQHKTETLVESNLFDIVDPSSCTNLRSLIAQVIKRANTTQGQRQISVGLLGPSETANNSKHPSNTIAACTDDKVNKHTAKDGETIMPAVCPTQFPMGVVVKLQQHHSATKPNVSNARITDKGSSTTSSHNSSNNNNALLSSKATSSLTDSNERNCGGSEEGSGSGVGTGDVLPEEPQSSDGDSNTGSTSNSSSERARKESESLARNVQSHNASRISVWRHTDDVIGDGVTENNAEARLSSLQHPASANTGSCKAHTSNGNSTTNSNRQMSNGTNRNHGHSLPSESQLQQETNSFSSDSLLTGVEDKPVVAREKKLEADDISTNSSRSQSTQSSMELLEEDVDVDDMRCSASASASAETHSGTPSPSSSMEITDDVHSHDVLGSRNNTHHRKRRRSMSRSDRRERTRRRSARNRPQPLAPTCNVRLLRADGTSVWCEVTCSVKTRTPEQQPEAEESSGGVYANGLEQEDLASNASTSGLVLNALPSSNTNVNQLSESYSSSGGLPNRDNEAKTEQNRTSLGIGIGNRANNTPPSIAALQVQISNDSAAVSTTDPSSSSSSTNWRNIEELLLCLRPIREGGTVVTAISCSSTNALGVVNHPPPQSHVQSSSSAKRTSSQIPIQAADGIFMSSSPSNTNEDAQIIRSGSNNSKLYATATLTNTTEGTQSSPSSSNRNANIQLEQEEEDNNCIVKSAVESLMLMNKVMHSGSSAAGVTSSNSSCNDKKSSSSR